MQEKIDWYQEVVDLEPSSKLFFPLAKMVAEMDTARAVATLQRGLDRHPEFIEARFYYVELLHKHRDQANYGALLEEQLSFLSPTLTRYADFWKAWSKSLSPQDGNLNDTALAAAFLGVMCDNQNTSLSEIFAAGLQSMMGEAASTSSAAVESAPVAEKPAPAVVTYAASEPVAVAAPAPVVTQEESAPVAPVAPVEPVAEPAPAVVEAAAPVAPTPVETPPATKTGNVAKIAGSLNLKPKIVVKSANVTQKKVIPAPQVVAADTEEDETEESFSLRTRSMADVLAEQGDIAAAVEIYNELIYAAENENERLELQEKIASFGAVHAQSVEFSAPADDVEDNSPGKKRVISVLESLADRLETRVHS